MSTAYRPDNTPQPPPALRFPTEYPDRTVLAFRKIYRSRGHTDAEPKQYQYVVVRIDPDNNSPARWYLTGSQNRVMTWEELVGFVGDSPCSIVSEWEHIPQTGSGDPGYNPPYVDPGVYRGLVRDNAPDW